MARIACSTPNAVTGDGSPDPPTDFVDTRDPGRLPGERVHVGGRRTDVLGREVATAEIVDRAAERLQELGRARAIGLGPLHHGLAPALVQTGDRGLVRHGLRQAERVEHCVDGLRVVPEPDPTERGPERGRVDRDHRGSPAASSLRYTICSCPIVAIMSVSRAPAPGKTAGPAFTNSTLGSHVAPARRTER